MRLLLDNNLSRRLVRELADEFPAAVHVCELGMSDADDEAIWRVARGRGLCIVSKDDDFRQRALVRGHPPKVVILRAGNCTTASIAAMLRRHVNAIRAFGDDPQAAVLLLE